MHPSQWESTNGQSKVTLIAIQGPEPYATDLKLSGCKEGNFTCNDGQCVSMDKRCNQCRDESDERHCNILMLKEGYNKNVPPITAQGWVIF